MQISPLTIYAIQALQELRQHGPLQGEEIARRLDISRAYSKKVFWALRQKGLVRNEPGRYVIVGKPQRDKVIAATSKLIPRKLTGCAHQTLKDIRKHGPLLSEEISKRLSLSRRYTNKLLFALCRADILRVVGGYVAVDGSTLLQVLEATEGVLPKLPGETPKMRLVRQRLRQRIAQGLGYVDAL